MEVAQRGTAGLMVSILDDSRASRRGGRPNVRPTAWSLGCS